MTPSAEGVICGIVSDLAVARANVRSCTETGGIAEMAERRIRARLRHRAASLDHLVGTAKAARAVSAPKFRKLSTGRTWPGCPARGLPNNQAASATR
jgi:hypothetical protein